MTAVAAENLERVDLSASVRRKLAQRAVYRTCVEIAGRAAEVGFDDAATCELFARRYRDHRTSRVPDLTYCVAGDERAHYFWSEKSLAWRWPERTTPQAVAFLADAALISAIVRSDDTLVSLHAAVVSHAGRIAAIGGDSTAGKSTTAFACVRRGMQFYSDERLLMRRTTVFPFQRTCSLRAHGRGLLAADDVDDDFLRDLLCDRATEERREISIAELFGRQAVAPPGPLRAIFVLRGYAQHPKVSEMSAFEAIPTLFRWMDSREGDLKRLAQLLELLIEVPCFSLELGTPGDSASAVAATLERLVNDAA